jgi:hypothetical protein
MRLYVPTSEMKARIYPHADVRLHENLRRRTTEENTKLQRDHSQTAFLPNASAAYPKLNWPITEPMFADALRKPSRPGGIE